MLSEKSDEELMQAYQLGNENAFKELYSRHSGRVLGFLRAKVRNEAKARDIFQATFLKLHRSKSRYNSLLPFVPWLFTICRNELVDTIRKERRSLEDSQAFVPEPANLHPANLAEVSHSKLSDVQQRAVQLRYGEESSFDEIAKALGTSPSNARQLVSRAIRSLRSIYGKK